MISQFAQRAVWCCSVVLAAPPPATASGNATPPPAFVAGAYEVVGRLPGAAGDTYHGWARIMPETSAFEVVRCIDGSYSEAQARMVYKTADRVPAFEVEFAHSALAIIATCTVGSDFDNMPRLVCLTVPAEDPSVAVPGLESYFPIVWPVATDYYACP